MSDDAGYSDDDEAAVYDTAALHTLAQLVSHAADRQARALPPGGRSGVRGAGCRR
jgi:hypothetical protein